MGKILSFLPVDGVNNLFHICVGESVTSIGWLLLFWNFLFNSHSCSGTVVLQFQRNFVDLFFFQKAVLSWPLVMGAFPIWLVRRRPQRPLTWVEASPGSFLLSGQLRQSGQTRQLDESEWQVDGLFLALPRKRGHWLTKPAENEDPEAIPLVRCGAFLLHSTL